MTEKITITKKDFYSSSEETQLLLLNFLKMNNKTEEIKGLIMNVPFAIKRQIEANEVVGIAHETIEFALTYFYDDINFFSSILEKVETDLNREPSLKSSKYEYGKYESFLIDGQPQVYGAKSTIPGTIQTNLYTKVVMDYVTNADEFSTKRFELLKNNKYIYYSTDIFGANEKIKKLEALNFVAPAKDIGVMEIFLGLGRVEDAQSVWDKNSQGANYSRKMKAIGVEQFWAANQAVYNQSSGCLSNVSLNSLRLWLSNPDTMFFLAEKIEQDLKVSLSTSINCLKFLFSNRDLNCSEKWQEFFQNKENSSVGLQVISRLYNKLEGTVPGEFLPGRDLINKDVLMVLVENYDAFLKKEFPEIMNGRDSFGNQRISGKNDLLKTIKYLLAYTPEDMCKNLWEKTPTMLARFAFGQGAAFSRNSLECLCGLEKKGVPIELLVDVFINSAKSSLAYFPNSFDASPFHMFISIASSNLLEKFLEKMKREDPGQLNFLLNQECWTLLDLNLRKKGDAFSVAVGLGDVEKTKILLKYSDEDIQAKSQIHATLKYLKAKGSPQHIKATSAFESLLLEKFVEEAPSVVKELGTELGAGVRKMKNRL